MCLMLLNIFDVFKISYLYINNVKLFYYVIIVCVFFVIVIEMIKLLYIV